MKIDKKKYEVIRARKCLSAKDLESEGIPRATIHAALQKNVRPETIGRIAKALGVDVTEIIED